MTAVSTLDEARTYLVRIPHYVLIHGEQLKKRRLTQDALWQVVGATKGRAHLYIKQLREDGYLNPYRPLALGPEMSGVIGVGLGVESLRAAWYDANGERRVEHSSPSVPGRFGNQGHVQTLNDIATAVNELLTKTMAAAHHEDQKPANAIDRRPLFVDRVVDGKPKKVLPLLGVAVAWPSPINRYTKVPEGTSLHRWPRRDLRALVADRLGLDHSRVHAVNDANAAALSVVFDELRGINAQADKRTDDADRSGQPQWEPTHTSLTIRVGGGVGAGIFAVGAYDPKSFSGFNEARLIETEYGVAGDIGHMLADEVVVQALNEGTDELAKLDLKWVCSCGKPGHVESLASATALARRLAATDNDDLFADLGIERGTDLRPGHLMHDAVQRIETRDAPAPLERAVNDMGFLLGHATASAVLALAPSTITFTGSGACRSLKEGFVKGVSVRGGFGPDNWPAPLRNRPITALSGDDNQFSPARGAALFVFRSQIYRELTRFERLLSKSGSRRLPRDDRVFSDRMHPLSEADLPLRAASPRAR